MIEVERDAYWVVGSADPLNVRVTVIETVPDTDIVGVLNEDGVTNCVVGIPDAVMEYELIGEVVGVRVVVEIPEFVK